MNEQKDFNGLKFNMLTVIGNAPSRRQPSGGLERRVMVKCECGNEKDTAWKSVKRGRIKSCGCLGIDKIDITTEDKYGYWTVLEEAEPYVTKDGKSRKVKAQCVCGEIRDVSLNSLRQGHSNSCGCKIEYKGATGKRATINTPIPDISIEKLQKRVKGDWTLLEIVSAERNEKTEIVRTVKMKCKCGYEKVCKTETMSDSNSCSECANKIRLEKYSDEERIIRNRLSGVYGSMSSRCNNPNSKDYKNYGGRGIQIEESFKPFQKFYDWAIGNGYTVDCKLEVDREDNDGNYSTDNCRLISKKENNRNMRRNVMNWELVNKIRTGEWKTLNNCEIARLIGCSSTSVRNVRNYDIWVE
jgi:hypothetical protein|nr:MAG TPA: hypothetical protein [Caudoviricetes sp.]